MLNAIPLPFGRPWTYMADLNVLLLSDQLDEAGQHQAVTEAAQAYCLN